MMAGEPELIEAVPEPGQLLVVQEHHEVGQERIAILRRGVPIWRIRYMPIAVAAEREEGAVAEREDAAIAPDEVDARAPASA